MAAVTLADVKAYLNKTSSTADDDELVDFLDRAVSAIEDVIGPVDARTVVEEIDYHGTNIVLSKSPVLSVTSVSIEPWIGANPVDDTAAWRVNPATGVLRRKVIGGSLPYYGPGSIFTITYMAGRTETPLPVVEAVLEVVRHKWQTQRSGGSVRPSFPGDEQTAPTYEGGPGYLMPHRVKSLLEPYILPPGVA